MGVGRSIVSELNVDNLKMSYPTPSTFVQPSTGGDGLWYVIYRLLMVMYMIGTTIASFIHTRENASSSYAGMHFPVWGYAICGWQSIFMAFCTLKNYYFVYKAASETTAKHKEKLRRTSSVSLRRKKKMAAAFSVSVPRMPKIYIVIWVFFYIMLFSSTMSFVKYETGLFKGKIVYATKNTVNTIASQVLLHQAFFGYCLIDFLVCGIPVRLLHAYVMVIYASVYHLALLTLTFVMSKKPNYRPLYDIADVQMHRIKLSSLYYVGFSLITPVAVHIIYYFLFLLRSYLIELYFRKTRVTTQKNEVDKDATEVPDEKGDEGATEWTPGTLRSSKILPISEQEEAEISSINKEQNPSNNSIALVDFK